MRVDYTERNTEYNMAKKIYFGNSNAQELLFSR